MSREPMKALLVEDNPDDAILLLFDPLTLIEKLTLPRLCGHGV